MQVNEIMSRQPQFLQMDQPVFEAAGMMRDGDVGFLPICDAERNVLGALTDRDITLRIVAAQRSSDTPVRDIMSPEMVSCAVTDTVHAAEEMMQKHQVSRLVCLDDHGKLAGILGLADLAKREGAEQASAVVRDVKSETESASQQH